jgi:hypothetical protein
MSTTRENFGSELRSILVVVGESITGIPPVSLSHLDLPVAFSHGDLLKKNLLYQPKDDMRCGVQQYTAE